MKKSVLFLLCLTIGLQFICRAAGYSLTLVPQTLSANGNTIELRVPEGLKVEFVAPLASPRFLALGPENELLVGSRGRVYRLPWPYTSSETLVSLPGFNHSVIYRNGNLYVAETGGLYSAAYSGPSTLLDATDFSLVVALPSETGGHSSRTVVTGPDQRLYIGIGISGNCSDEYLDNSYLFQYRRGGVYTVDETGGQVELVPYSSGLRNPIGLAFHPWTDVLYASNAGPDNLGYDNPPEVFAPLSYGSFHGMPWFQFYDGQFRDGECIFATPPKSINEATPPAATFDARSTPEGIAFVTTSLLGPKFWGNALVAIHGSWAVQPGGGNASRRPPKIAMVNFTNNQATVVEDVVTGFQRTDGSRFARPCGMIMGPDGKLYFTSDSGEVTGLFRLSPAKNPPSLKPTLSSIYHLLLRDLAAD